MSEHLHGRKTHPKTLVLSTTVADLHQEDSADDHPLFTNNVRRFTIDYSGYDPSFQIVSPPKHGFDSDFFIIQADVNDQSDFLRK